MKLKKLTLSAVLAVFCATAVLAAGPAGNSNGSTAVGNGSGAAAYFSASASPGVPACLGPTSGPNNLIVSVCNAPGGVVTAVTGTGNIQVTAGATPVVSITNSPTFTGTVTANQYDIGTTAGPQITTGTAIPTLASVLGSIYMDTTAGAPPDFLFSSFPVAFASVGAASGANHSYTLNDTNTTAIDSISYQNGTYSGTYTQSQAALSSDASASTAFGPGQVQLPFTDINRTGSFSVEFLVNLSSLSANCFSTNGCILVANTTYANTGTSGFSVQYNPSLSSFYFLVPGCTANGVAPVTGTTYDIVATYNATAGTCSLFVQGALVSSNTGAAYTSGGQNIQFATGISCGSACSMTGRMQSVSLYPYALNANQAAVHYSTLTASGWVALPTTISASGPLIATTVAGSTVGIQCPTCQIFTQAGVLVGPTFHGVQWFGSCTLSAGSCTASISLPASPTFSSTGSYSCSGNIVGTGGTTGAFISMYNSSPTQVNAVANSVAVGVAQMGGMCWGT
jgi:Concanavalin A-like lectin/glucanases superfamily